MPFDPAPDLARIAAATERLLQTVQTLDDDALRAPSLLPGWSRGHVLAHVARNADSLLNLLTWARTGEVTPQYPSVAARERGIADGAGRSLAEHLEDLQASAERLAEAARALPADRWEVHVQPAPGIPARLVLARRRREIEVHHVDLGAGYRPQDWPSDFVSFELTEVLDRISHRPDVPTVTLRATDQPMQRVLGRADTVGPVVTGPAASLLAWVLGRGDAGSPQLGLSVDPPGRLPQLPPWQ